MSITLLAVCGLSPQVLTETVYALAQQGRLPDRIRVLTTRSGRDTCLSQLFDGGKGAWHRLLADLGLPEERVDFTPEQVIAVTDEKGRQIDDISNEDENEIFLRACLRLAWEYSRQAGETVFYSIAGGRKTMGAALGFAAQAYGRRQDRIYHVLVSPEFENCRDFFFPPSRPVDVTLRDPQGQPYRKSTRYARIQLVSLPFFSFRTQLTDQLLEQPREPATLLAGLVREEPPQLTIDLKEHKLIWKDRETDLRPVHLALYTLFAEIKKDTDCQSTNCHDCDRCWLPQHQLLARQQQLSRIYRDIVPSRDPQEMSDSGIFNLTPDNFQSYRSKLNRAIEKGFGGIDAPLLQIGSRGKRPGKRYGIALNRDVIRIVR